MIDVKVRRILIEEEAARTPRRQRDRALHMRVELHVLRTEDSVARLALLQRHLVAEKGIGEEIEVIAVGGLVVDAAVALVAVEID